MVTVTTPGEHTGVDADAAITRAPLAKLAVRTADCVPVVLLGEDAIGVVQNAAAAMRDLGADEIGAVIGPHIGPECYEFGTDDLDGDDDFDVPSFLK